MAGVTVFVFLLERLPGFEVILNSTLLNMGANITNNNLNICDPVTADSMWRNVNQKNYNKIISLHKKTGSTMDNMMFGNDIFEKSEIKLANNYFRNEKYDEYFLNNIESEDLPKGAPYLVAIFETVSNLTAQTCGGTLLSPSWVVTAAACLDVLAYYKYENEPKQIRLQHKIRYSVVANAMNPVEDGTLHNVTDIFIHPQYNASLKHPNESFGNASLALMKIEPAAVKITSVNFFTNTIRNDMDVRVYGWILKKNSTGQDSMTIASFSTKTLDPNQCKSSYNFPNKSVICLRANETNKIKISQMSSGGSVVVLYRNMFQLVGVAQADITSSLAVCLFAPHLDWITSLVGEALNS